MIKSKCRKIVFAMFLLLIPCFKVHAKVINVDVCFRDQGLYNVTYDTSVNTMFNINNLSPGAVAQGHFDYPNGIPDERYDFKATKVAPTCYGTGDNVKSCPSDNSISYAKISSAYLDIKDGGVNGDNVHISFNEDDGTFNIKIDDNFDGKVRIRHVQKGMQDNYDYGYGAAYYSGQFLELSGKSYRINNVSGDTAIKLEFYQNIPGDCDGYYIGSISFYTPSADTMLVDNPIYKNPNAYGCDKVRAYKPDGMKSEDEIKAFNKLKENFIPECYPLDENSKITYLAKKKLSKTISDAYAELKKLFQTYQSVSASGGNKCTEQYNSPSKVTYSYSGTYWSAYCTEQYTAQGDTPKLVKAGGGFSYMAKYTLRQQCWVTHRAQVEQPPACQPPSAECSCTGKYAGQEYTCTTPPCSAGPSKDFDKCIHECDGGKYTQACINSCYNQNYNDGRTIDANFSIDNKNSNIGFMASHDIHVPGGSLSPSRPGTSPYGYKGFYYEYEGAECFVSDACGNAGYGCTFHVVDGGPPGCSEDPCVDWDNMIRSSYSEINSISSHIDSAISENNGNYKFEITDSYLKNGLYVTVIDSSKDPHLKVVPGGVQVLAESTSSATLGGADPEGCGGNVSVNYKSHTDKIKEINVYLPLSYVNKLTAKSAHMTDGGKTKYFIDPTNSSSSFTKDVDVSGNLYNDNYYYFTPGERKYYTNVNSPNINIELDKKAMTVRLLDYKKEKIDKFNIHVTSEKIGEGNFGSKIQCYYGVYDRCPDCKDDICDPKTEICTGERDIIFRPVDLDDLFPNGRDPRYNWSCKANQYSKSTYNIYNTDIVPVELTKQIEATGDKVYNDSELEYEFILTKDNIKAIQNYNRTIENGGHSTDYNGDKSYDKAISGSNNYLDFNLDCMNNGFCRSRFLSNIGISGTSGETFVKYGDGYTVAKREGIIGCNNASNAGSSCDTKKVHLDASDLCRRTKGKNAGKVYNDGLDCLPGDYELEIITQGGTSQ